ncbi:hypothetical protein D1871_11975 [Nakamurella silvestris]|nr:hypothetical protein D1871_11975 [Nakamurella silvestris]
MRSLQSVRRVVTDVYANGLADGWATASLRNSMRRTLLFAITLWQFAMLWAVFNSTISTESMMLLAAGHLMIGTGALLARASLFPAGLLLALVWAMSVADWSAAPSIDSALALAACWNANLAAACPVFTMKGIRALILPLVASAAVPVGIMVVQPSWGTEFPGAVLVTTLSITVAVRYGIQFLVDFTGRIDEETSRNEAEIREAVFVRTAVERSVEDARVMHDTAINTLGAIAWGGAATDDLPAVRSRCRQDLATMRSMVSGVDTDASSAGAESSLERFGPLVQRSGLTDEQVQDLLVEFPPSTAELLAGAVHELVQNAVKHAGASTIRVGIETVGDDLRFTVADNGAGFEVDLRSSRGLARSVIDRVHAAGARIDIDSTVGSGTTAVLRLGLTPPPDRSVEWQVLRVDFDEVMRRLRIRASFVWAVGLTGVGLSLSLINQYGEFTEHYLMTLVAALAVAYAWRAGAWEGSAARHIGVVLTLGSAIAFVFSAAATDFGTADVVLWQAIGPTAPLIVLVATQRRSSVITAVAAYSLTVLAVATVVWFDSPTASAVLPIGGLAALGLVGAWSGFQKSIASISAQAMREQRVAVASQVESAKAAAADKARQRFRETVLHRPIALLEGIADGHMDPREHAIMDDCAAEEQFLRQLMLLDPGLLHLGHWLARVLDRARLRRVEVSVHSGDVDVADDRTAAALGALLLSIVDNLPAGVSVTVSLFGTMKGSALMVVGPHPHVDRAVATSSPGTGLDVLVTTIDRQDLVEITLAGNRLSTSVLSDLAG